MGGRLFRAAVAVSSGLVTLAQSFMLLFSSGP